MCRRQTESNSQTDLKKRVFWGVFMTLKHVNPSQNLTSNFFTNATLEKNIIREEYLWFSTPHFLIIIF